MSVSHNQGFNILVPNCMDYFRKYYDQNFFSNCEDRMTKTKCNGLFVLFFKLINYFLSNVIGVDT